MILDAIIRHMLSDQDKPALRPKVETFADRASHDFERLVLELAESKVTRDGDKYEAAMKRIREYVAGILILGNLTGRRSMLIEADRIAQKVAARVHVAIHLADIPGDIPKVEFKEAIEDLLARDPRLARGAADVARIYANQHAFAIARVTDLKVTRRVQEEIARALKDGWGFAQTTKNVAKILGGMEDYAEAYASTVVRTNTMTAFTAGQFQEARDPDVADVVPAFEFSSVGDGDTRPNHQAADGLLAATNDPVWNRFAPPLGHQCRCSINTVDIITLRRRGLIDANGQVRPYYPPSFANAYPDKGFGMGRPGQGLPVGV